VSIQSTGWEVQPSSASVCVDRDGEGKSTSVFVEGRARVLSSAGQGDNRIQVWDEIK